MSDLLAKNEIATALKKLPEWEVEGKAITRTLEFDEFNDAIDFVNGLAEIVDEAQHYPEITINYNRVSLRLTTEEEGGVTQLDIELALRIDNLAD